MNNLVCSLETAKKLKEAGWNKETKFLWTNSIITDDFVCVYWKEAHTPEEFESETGIKDIRYPAPTLQEALDRIPMGVYLKRMICNDKIIRWLPYKQTKSGDRYMVEIDGHENPTEAACMLWLKLREEKLI